MYRVWEEPPGGSVPDDNFQGTQPVHSQSQPLSVDERPLVVARLLAMDSAAESIDFTIDFTTDAKAIVMGRKASCSVVLVGKKKKRIFFFFSFRFGFFSRLGGSDDFCDSLSVLFRQPAASGVVSSGADQKTRGTAATGQALVGAVSQRHHHWRGLLRRVPLLDRRPVQQRNVCQHGPTRQRMQSQIVRKKKRFFVFYLSSIW